MTKTTIRLVHVDTLSCEAILRKAPNGELIILSQTGGVKEPAPENRVYAFHSKDRGRTWTKTVSVHPEDGRAVYCTEVHVSKGKIHAFLTLHDGHFLESEHIIMTSEDSGYSWTRSDIDFGLPGFVFYRGVCDLGDGKIMIPYQHYEVTSSKQSDLKRSGKYIWNADIDHVNAGVLVCEDDFKNIDHRGTIPIPLFMDGVKRWQWPEPTLARLSDGRLVMLVRINHTGRLYQAFSEDEGKTWTPLEKTTLKNPGNKPKLIGMPDGRLALLNTFNEGSAYIDRQPLSVWITDDDMETWSYQEVLVDFPGWHSYPDGIVDDDGSTILLAFEFNRHDIYFVEHRTR